MVELTNSMLSVVIPVREIDGQALGALQELAMSAPALHFIAVGKLVTSERLLIENLEVIDKDCSIYEAMNEGTRVSASEYLLYMGIDDRLLAQNVNSALDQLSAMRDSSMIIIPFRVGDRLVKQEYGGKITSFHHQGVLFRRDDVVRLGCYGGAYLLHSDLDLMFRMQKSGRVDNLGIPLVIFSKGGATTSGKNACLSIREINAIYATHGISRLRCAFLFSIALLMWYRLRFVFGRP